MGLYTKSAQVEKSDADGIRICIMRRPDANLVWDIWMPTLAPSCELLDAYRAGAMSWDTYCLRFHDEVIIGMHMYLEILVDMSKKYTVTIICWEDTPERCHRRLVAQACKSMAPDLDVIIV
jgi:uncharacterized protein YeaO (DUF488 family)